MDTSGLEFRVAGPITFGIADLQSSPKSILALTYICLSLFVSSAAMGILTAFRPEVIGSEL
jgi:hypothetical protein